MSLFGHDVCETAGAGVACSGTNDQNARCSGLITYAGDADAAAGTGLPAEPAGAASVGLPAEALSAEAGHGAPARTHSTSASTSDGFRRPPFGIFSVSRVWRTAWISRLLSGSPRNDRGTGPSAFQQPLARVEAQAAHPLVAVAVVAVRGQDGPD